MGVCTQLQQVSWRMLKNWQELSNSWENLSTAENTLQQDSRVCCMFHLSKRDGEITSLQAISSSMRREDGQMCFYEKKGRCNEWMAGDRKRQCGTEVHLFNTRCDQSGEKTIRHGSSMSAIWFIQTITRCLLEEVLYLGEVFKCKKGNRRRSSKIYRGLNLKHHGEVYT